MIITSAHYPSKEQLEADIQSYAYALEAHKFTEGIPAPLSPNDLVENIVKGNLSWSWEQLPESTQATSDIETQIDGFEFVSDLYNDFLAKRFYYDNLEDYQKARADAYPPIGDQLDDLFHAGVFSEEMIQRIQAVKDTYPKPSGVV